MPGHPARGSALSATRDAASASRGSDALVQPADRPVPGCDRLAYPPVRMTTLRLTCQLAFAAILGGCGGAETAEPASQPSTAPRSYCDALQPTLDRAARQAGLSDALRCLDTPGISEIGTYGPRGRHDANHLGSCFPDAESAQAVVDQSPPFQLGFTLERTVGMSAGGRLDLSSIASWLPALEATGSGSGTVDVRITVDQAHFRTITDLAHNLRQHRGGAQCLSELCDEDRVYTHKSLMGTLVVEVASTSAENLQVGASVTEMLGFEVERHDGERAQLVMRSEQPLTLAASVVPSRVILEPSGACEACGGPDQPCCPGETCNAGALCTDGGCQACGGPTQPCCEGTCDEGAFCHDDTCQPDCGLAGESCCGGQTCAADLECAPAEAPPRVEEQVLSTEETVAGGLFGRSEDRVYGGACGPDRLRSGVRTTRVSGSGDCDRHSWVSPDVPTDCRVEVHYGVPSLQDLRCRIEVFATRPGDADGPAGPVCQ